MTAKRAAADAPSPPWARRVAITGCALLVLVIAACALGSVVTEAMHARDPSVDSWIEGTRLEVLAAERVARYLPRVHWAFSAPRASSVRHALDAPSLLHPRVFPRHELRDDDAWSPYADDAGIEWIAAEWASAVRARRIVVLETFHPGAVVALHDTSDEIAQPMLLARRTGLWRGTTPRRNEARALVFTLAAPRYLQRVRLVLDTRRAPGRNAIDAIGLLAD
ncbi:MAG: hypothetical protein IT379_18225 [Deltaproteobacteria bacterium]|nr:hypothetical protein [Deltaproteobacteria bacterium]